MNPFNPSFGSRPERFVGRAMILKEFSNAIEHPNSPWRTTLLTGVRGSGKTALLTDISKQLLKQGVFVVSVTPQEDFLDTVLAQLYLQMPQGIKKMLPTEITIKTGVEVKMGFDRNVQQPYFTESFRYQITLMLDVLKKKNRKVVFLIDEAQKHSEAIRTFISTYQHLIREEYGVSMIMAGLPNVISDILNDDILTFLRRANRITLPNIEINLVQLDYTEAFMKGGFYLSGEALRKAAQATYGYPYLIQLLGFYLWVEMENGSDEHFAYSKALVQSKTLLFQNVHELIYHELSEVDKEFLQAMAIDNNVSSMQDILVRMGRPKNYVANYRARMLDFGIIQTKEWGKVEFTLPYMGEYLREKARNEDF